MSCAGLIHPLYAAQRPVTASRGNGNGNGHGKSNRNRNGNGGARPAREKRLGPANNPSEIAEIVDETENGTGPICRNGRQVAHELDRSPFPKATEILNAFTVDVEDYFQVSAFEKCVDRGQWGEHESRVVSNTHRLLNLLERHRVKAHAFFCSLGWVARRAGQLLRDIQLCGHEIGSHGYWHRLIYQQSPDEFRNDLRQLCAVLEDAVGCPVSAYSCALFFHHEAIAVGPSIPPWKEAVRPIPACSRSITTVTASPSAGWVRTG